MAFLEGKSPAEKKKIVAAAILGVVSLFALYMAFGRSLFGGSTTTATTKASPTPTPKGSNSTAMNNNQFRVPSDEENVANLIVPVVYNPGNTYGAPDPGRNIFAFYEPPPPTPFVPITPTPTPPPIVPTPTPPPPPPFTITSISPQSVYAGTRGGFKLEIAGDKFTPDARIYFNQTEMPTQFQSPQLVAATIPENLVAQEGQRQIIIQTPDGRFYSAAFLLNVIAPPKPSSLQYIGMIGRTRFNNDTAYFMESGKQNPFGARLNDVVGGRFRIVGITAAEVTVEDVSLGFKHKIAMATSSSGTGNGPGGGFIPYTPGMQPGAQGRPIPGQPGRPPQRPPNSKDDVDDNDNPNR